VQARRCPVPAAVGAVNARPFSRSATGCRRAPHARAATLARLALAAILVFAAAGCSGLRSGGEAGAADGAAAESGLERDRAAIRALAGGYRVRFRFRETAVLIDGYERAEPRRSGGHELVLVIADGPGRIELQHLLVSADGGHVTKHWRQVWQYEAGERLVYSGDQNWHLRPVDAPGSWTQCVYGVADSPRYCGTGYWRHEHGVSTWTSDRIWRPLPRREHTQRDDYDLLAAHNRHTITPAGWTHEQDNTKLRVSEYGGMQGLVREVGFNSYTRDPDFDFSPAREYWAETADYWQRVRAAWAERIERHGGIRRTTALDGMGIIEPLFRQAQRVRRGETVATAAIERVLDRSTEAPGGD